MDAEASRLEINLQVDGDLSPFDMDAITAAVRRELLLLDVQSVDRVSSGPAPGGARGIDLAAIGALIVSLGETAPVLAQVVEAIRAWTARSPSRMVKLTLQGDTLEVGGMSESDQHRVIKEWMARHPRPSVRRAPTT